MPELGPLLEDAAFDPALLESVTALKLSEEEAAVAAGAFDGRVAAALGVPEVLLTLGSHGEDVCRRRQETFVPPPGPCSACRRPARATRSWSGTGRLAGRRAHRCGGTARQPLSSQSMLEERKHAS